MKCSVYIATSADGYIATIDGGVDWLHSAGNTDADMSDNPDMGFADYIASVDCMIMGRKCMEVISSFDLTAEQWPYGDIKIYALSRTLKQVPNNLLGKVELYSGDIHRLISKLNQEGFTHAYIDGGTTITSFINQQLINEMTITQAPILLGTGLPLFGDIHQQVSLISAKATAFANNFIQTNYHLQYDKNK